MEKNNLGKYFEQIAVIYLSKIGYKIIDQNYYCKCGELDIISTLNQEIVFVEVKSINSNSDYSIYKSLTRKKLNKIKKAAQYWLRSKHLENKVYRIEFIGIISYPNKYVLNHNKYIEFI